MLRLFLNGGNQVGVPMSKDVDGHARHEVNVFAALQIVDAASPPPYDRMGWRA